MTIISLHCPEQELLKSVEIGLKNGDLSIIENKISQEISMKCYPYPKASYLLSNLVLIEVYYLPNFTSLEIHDLSDGPHFFTEDGATINRLLIAIGKRLTES